MKKMLLALTILAISTTSAAAFDLNGIADQKNKAQLQSCLSSEAQNMLVAGKLVGKDVDTVAKELAKTCATKLSVASDNQTIALATTVLKAVMK